MCKPKLSRILQHEPLYVDAVVELQPNPANNTVLQLQSLLPNHITSTTDVFASQNSTINELPFRHTYVTCAMQKAKKILPEQTGQGYQETTDLKQQKLGCH